MPMTTDTIRVDEKDTADVATAKTTTLAAIVDSVKQDCRQAATDYLEETKVPHGGE